MEGSSSHRQARHATHRNGAGGAAGAEVLKAGERRRPLANPNARHRVEVARRGVDGLFLHALFAGRRVGGGDAEGARAKVGDADLAGERDSIDAVSCDGRVHRHHIAGAFDRALCKGDAGQQQQQQHGGGERGSGDSTPAAAFGDGGRRTAGSGCRRALRRHDGWCAGVCRLGKGREEGVRPEAWTRAGASKNRCWGGGKQGVG